MLARNDVEKRKGECKGKISTISSDQDVELVLFDPPLCSSECALFQLDEKLSETSK